jgi:hypothetical protein
MRPARCRQRRRRSCRCANRRRRHHDGDLLDRRSRRNQEPSKTLTIRVDKTPPTTYVLRSPLPDESGVNHGPVTLTLQALDVAGSGIEQIITLDGAQTGGGTPRRPCHRPGFG